LLKEQDLVGLEDDPDFRNMEINTNSALTTESSLKKEDITAGTFHANPRDTCTLPLGPRCRKKDIQTTSHCQEAAKDLDYDRVEAETLPNGSYE
jgi:hypothetical protein